MGNLVIFDTLQPHFTKKDTLQPNLRETSEREPQMKTQAFPV